jgi:tRNA nucleotidyltransferase/poly(A) polymerase
MQGATWYAHVTHCVSTFILDRTLAALSFWQAQVNEYLASQGKETHTAAVIHSNPDQSKHLETARMKVNALWIDLVNLRSETYADGSRIPKMEFGTPLQDAMRR